jgi:predicted RNA-binding protein with EMAP domain
MTATHSTDAGVGLVALLKQQRCFYHQFKILAERQSQLGAMESGELSLQFIFGRRKLVEKLTQISGKLRPIKANWARVADHIRAEQMSQVYEMAHEVDEIIDELESSAEGQKVFLSVVEHCRLSDVISTVQV